MEGTCSWETTLSFVLLKVKENIVILQLADVQTFRNDQLLLTYDPWKKSAVRVSLNLKKKIPAHSFSHHLYLLKMSKQPQRTKSASYFSKCV